MTMSKEITMSSGAEINLTGPDLPADGEQDRVAGFVRQNSRYYARQFAILGEAKN